MTAGAGLECPLGPGRLVAEVRACYSFTSYYDENGGYSQYTWYPFSVMAMAGYSIPIEL